MGRRPWLRVHRRRRLFRWIHCGPMADVPFNNFISTCFCASLVIVFFSSVMCHSCSSLWMRKFRLLLNWEPSKLMVHKVHIYIWSKSSSLVVRSRISFTCPDRPWVVPHLLHLILPSIYTSLRHSIAKHVLFTNFAFTCSLVNFQLFLFYFISNMNCTYMFIRSHIDY